jgi:hypothetical protein
MQLIQAVSFLPHRRNCVSFKRNSLLLLVMEFVVYSENRVNHIHVAGVQNTGCSVL